MGTLRSRGRGPRPDVARGTPVVTQGLDGAVVWKSGKLGSDSVDEGTEARREEK